jgi:CubicO group peptidase (beta-lactamase class C family)
MRISYQWLIAIIVIFAFTACNGQSKENSVKETADQFYRKNKVPGLFIATLENGKRSYYSYGYADPDNKKPFDSATFFEIGSITKTFTAYVLTAVLKEKGIAETQSIISFLPDSVQENKALGSITFLSLMNHSSGLDRIPSNMDLNSMTPYDQYLLSDLFSYLKKCTLHPDGKSNYSNTGMGLAGILAEKISGKKYSELLDQYIFIPFKMGRADVNILKEQNKAQGHLQGNKSGYWNMAALAPAGNIKSTAASMLNYLKAVSMPPHDSIARIINHLLEPTITISTTMKIGRAWHIFSEKDLDIYWHNGGTYGFYTFAAFKKGEGKAFILIINSFNTDGSGDDLGFTLAREFFK